jgi:hypothetical protein
MKYLTRLFLRESGIGVSIAEFQIWDNDLGKWVTKVKIPVEIIDKINVEYIKEDEIKENLYIQDKLLGLVEHAEK